MLGIIRTLCLVICVGCLCSADSSHSDRNSHGPEYSGNRKFFIDSGYGSRVNAGTNVADALTTYSDVYGAYGPGKRSAMNQDYAVKQPLDDGKLSKRLYTDLGYGSRVSAGKNVAHAKLVKDTVFGARGPGKRSTEDEISLDLLNKIKRGEVSDAGYLSRVDAAKLIARDIDTGYNIFGHMGPGKRR